MTVLLLPRRSALLGLLSWLLAEPLTPVVADRFVLAESDACAAGRQLAGQQMDGVLAVITTFVPDYFLVEFLSQCDVPVFLWAVEREMQCISLVCGLLNTATLHNLGKPYRLFGADVGDEGRNHSASQVS